MKLIAIDMDGTLLSSVKTISEENKKALQEAKNAGHTVMICTGRHHETLLTYLADQQLDFPISASNGAYTQNKEKIIHQASLEVTKGAQIFEWLQRNRYPFKFYTDHGAFCEHDFILLAEAENKQVPTQAGEHWSWDVFLEYQKASHLLPIQTFEEVIHNDSKIFKFYVYTPQVQKKEALKKWLGELGGIQFTSSMDDNVEIMGTDGHKGTGIIQMANALNIPMADTVAIGDNHNDIPMLKAAGTAIAMGNAVAEVKSLCDFVTLSNDEDGVAYAIREFVLKEGD